MHEISNMKLRLTLWQSSYCKSLKRGKTSSFGAKHHKQFVFVEAKRSFRRIGQRVVFNGMKWETIGRTKFMEIIFAINQILYLFVAIKRQY